MQVQFRDFCLILFVLSLLASPVSASEAPRYIISAQVDVNHKKISAQEAVKFVNNTATPVHELYFHIYPNRVYTKAEKKIFWRTAGFFKVNPFPEGFQTPRLDIQSIKKGGKDIPFVVEGKDQTLLKVPLSQALNPGESVEINIDFSLALPHAYGRCGWHQSIIQFARWYPILSVYDSAGLPSRQAGWHAYPFYPFHRPFFSEASFYSVQLTVPDNQVVIHSGELVEEKKINDARKVLSIESKEPLRDFAFVVSPDYQLYEDDLNGVTIKSFYLPGDKEHAVKAARSAKDMMAFYAGQFCPYPYKTFSIAPVYLGYGGEQMSNLIFIDTRVFKLPGLLDRYFDFLIAHETGHQWLFNLVGMDEYKEMWLEEGVHSYFVLKYLEQKYGKNAEVINWPRWVKKYKWIFPEFTFIGSRETRYKTLSRIGLDKSVVGELASFEEPSSIFSITYGKGSRIVSMLYHQLGDETFKRIFRRIFTEFRFKNLKIDDFKKIVQEESGKDLTEFFKKWLYSTEHFDAAVKKVKGNKITLENKGRIAMPVEVKVTARDGSQQTLIWDGAQKEATIAVPANSRIKKVELDPDNKILDWDRANNYFPLKVNVKLVPFYLGLYDVPALMPDDGYNVIVGPEFANGGLGVKTSWQKPYDYNIYAATDYEFSENIQHSRVGVELSHLFESPIVLGVEMDNKSDYDNGEEDLVSGKVFLRRELSLVPYGLASVNDHMSLYLIRNRGLNNTLLLGGSEDQRNISYLKRDEAIVGANMHLEESAPYPDPHQGFRLDTFAESSGHFLGATQYFYRGALDASFYQPITLNSKLGLRLKAAGGFPNDKNLFELGGSSGLRGYDRKTVRGANALLGSCEYRFPLKKNLNLSLFDNIISVDEIDAAIFFDAGKAWYGSFNDRSFKKDLGAGLRLSVNMGSFLEKAILRLDVARAINQSDEDDPHVWFGVGQAF